MTEESNKKIIIDINRLIIIIVLCCLAIEAIICILDILQNLAADFAIGETEQIHTPHRNIEVVGDFVRQRRITGSAK